MNCARCGRIIPDRKLSCPVCLEAAGEKASFELQQSMLPRVMAGEVQFNVCRTANGRVHIQLFGTRDRAYCGKKLPVAEKTRWRSAYASITDQVTCGACQTELASQVAQIRGGAA